MKMYAPTVWGSSKYVWWRLVVKNTERKKDRNKMMQLHKKKSFRARVNDRRMRNRPRRGGGGGGGGGVVDLDLELGLGI
ncbi:hypothetical protein P167DRAFT_405417 [Morchella conica CCBAS932]|uniref:Uncharacterized protein n=1 Tax=Morchella conica CCBAS932 TaxID=1392247 RepID=A0A3N4KY85_9PEZI|nr:hypothetical protein P167DRAFT_405417 [Morchella conica CCBAS932]